jgi:hypothetical protein
VTSNQIFFKKKQPNENKSDKEKLEKAKFIFLTREK